MIRNKVLTLSAHQGSSVSLRSHLADVKAASDEPLGGFPSAVPGLSTCRCIWGLYNQYKWRIVNLSGQFGSKSFGFKNRFQ